MGKFDKNSDKTSRPASNKRAPQKKSGGGTVLGIFLGLVVGVVMALLTTCLGGAFGGYIAFV